MSRKSKAEEFLETGYNITVTGRNVQITDSMKDYAIEKIAKLEKFVDRIIDVNITMDIQKIDHRVDIVLQFNNVKIKSHASSENMYASIDMAVHKLEKQLIRYKTRLREHHTKNLSSVEMNVNVFAIPEDEVINDEIESENHQKLLETFKPHTIVNSEKKNLHFLTHDEAIMKMDLSGDGFLIFRGEEDRKLKVIYRRNDGNYGVIEVEA